MRHMVIGSASGSNEPDNIRDFDYDPGSPYYDEDRLKRQKDYDREPIEEDATIED